MRKILRRIWNMLNGRDPDYDVTYTAEIANLDNYASVPDCPTILDISKLQAEIIDASMINNSELNDDKIASVFKYSGYYSNELLTPNEMRIAMGIDCAIPGSDISVNDIYREGKRVCSYVQKGY